METAKLKAKHQGGKKVYSGQRQKGWLQLWAKQQSRPVGQQLSWEHLLQTQETQGRQAGGTPATGQASEVAPFPELVVTQIQRRPKKASAAKTERTDWRYF